MNYGNTALIASIPTDVTELSGLSSNSGALETLFALKTGAISEPFVLGSNVLVAICTGIQTDAPAELTDYASTVLGYDRSSASDAILSSEKFTDNFLSTYMQYFLAN